MMSWMITSSVLILLVCLFRAVFRRRISPGLQYALWLLVLLRLLLPGTWFSSAFSVMNTIAPPEREVQTTQNRPLPTSTVVSSPEGVDAQTTQDVPALEADVPAPDPGMQAAEIHRILWGTGVVIAAGLLLITNFRFNRRLLRIREPYPAKGGDLPVYLAPGIPSCCLFGLFRPAIYLTPEAVEDPACLPYVLAHERTHFRHRDNWWSLLRCLALILHWYNPLAWLAAALSRQDGESACDAATIRALGEEHRLEYGKTLIHLAAQKQSPVELLYCATTIHTGKRTLKKRIQLLAQKPKTLASGLIAVVALVILGASCTFSGPVSAAMPDALPTLEETLTPVVTPDSFPVTISVPPEYEDLLVVHSEPENADRYGITLFSVQERASVEQARADGLDAEHGIGLLFSIRGLTRAGFEQHLQGGFGSIFAMDEARDTYYLLVTPSDFPMYRSGNQAPDYTQWTELYNLRYTVAETVIAENGLTPYTADTLRSQPYTYTGSHAYIRFYQHPSDPDDFIILVLSQPVRQGNTGIWCVERWVDPYERTYLYFPRTGIPAMEYYVQLQAQCDNGQFPAMCTPLGAAKAFVSQHYPDVTWTDAYFQETESVTIPSTDGDLSVNR